MLFYTLLERYFLKKNFGKGQNAKNIRGYNDSDINEEIEEWLITKLEIKNAIEDVKNG